MAARHAKDEQEKRRKRKNMGDNGNKHIVSRKETPWFENHPSRPSGKALPILTIILWASEDRSLSRAIGWLKEAVPDDIQRKKLNQAIHKHIEDILAEMIQSGLVKTEEGKLALREEKVFGPERI